MNLIECLGETDSLYQMAVRPGLGMRGGQPKIREGTRKAITKSRFKKVEKIEVQLEKKNLFRQEVDKRMSWVGFVKNR